MPLPIDEQNQNPAFAPPVVRFRYDRYSGMPWLKDLFAPVSKALVELSQAKEDDPRPALAFFGAIIVLLFSAYFIIFNLPLFVLWMPAVLVLIGLVLIGKSTFAGGTIILDAKGLTYKKSRLLGTSIYPWKSLVGIIFAKHGEPTTQASEIILQYSDERQLTLELNAFSRDTLAALVNIALFHKPKIQILPVECRSAFAPAAGDELSLFNFTELWQNDLEERFAPTSFIPLEQGQKLKGGQLTVLGQIASGGMSAIYLAMHPKLRTVVLKESVLPVIPNSDAAAKAVELFRRESLLLSVIDHPRIVKIFDYFVENERHYLMLEHVQGRTLRTFVRENGAVAEKTIIDWGIQMARILEYLHTLETPIVHRDFTPENLILSSDAKIKVIDFGASATFVSTATGTVIGKIAYMPPEQIKGKAKIASDIYALGGVLFYLACGQDPKPYAGNILPPHSAVHSQKLVKLIEDCLQLRSEDRPQSATEVSKRLLDLQAPTIGGKH